MALHSIPAWSAIFKFALGVLLMTQVVMPLVAAPSPDRRSSDRGNTINSTVKRADPEKIWGNNQVMIVCYHDVPTRLYQDHDGVDLFSFARELEFMRDFGCKFVSVDDILAAAQGKRKLPEKAVLLTFDDSYESFYKNVYPLLQIYRYPCMLAVISGWIEKPPKDPAIAQYKFMTWAQLKEVANSGLVTLASHSNDLHRGVQCNPQGNTAHAMITRRYDPATGRYETEAELRQRIFRDLETSRQTIVEKTGQMPPAVVWPYGRYNEISLEEAFRAGYKLTFSLDDGVATAAQTRVMPRYMLVDNPPIEQFVRKFKVNFTAPPDRQRILQADLDLIYDEDPKEQEKNLDAFIERIYRIKPSAVFLQAYSDLAGNGNISSVYFPNRVLPMKADLFSRVCRAVNIRGIMVYAWMPMLAIKLPDEKTNARLRVKEFKNGKITDSTAWYTNRLSPFAPETAQMLETLYADLAANALIDGIVFQDDGYLNDFEDYNPAAQKEYLKISKGKLVPFSELNEQQQQQWTRKKTRQLNELTEKLKKQVLYYRPCTFFARTIYAPVALEPDSEEWFAQNYGDCLKNYDYTVIMSYPRMEKVGNPEKWLAKIVAAARKHLDGIAKTIFKVQTYDWERKEWIPTGVVLSWLQTLAAAGAWNLAYYPDDYTVDQPRTAEIIRMMSARDFPDPTKKPVIFDARTDK